MSTIPSAPETFRVLVIDDAVAIHDDVRRVLAGPSTDAKLEALERATLADHPAPPAPAFRFEIDSAYQGEEGINLVLRAQAARRPYAVAFIDMRMPPGIDGRETIRRLWQLDADIQVVLCTAYSDYTWEEMASTTGPTSRLVILRKPFEAIEVRQLAHILALKWQHERKAREQLEELEHRVAERTEEMLESRAVAHLIVEETLREKNAVPRAPSRARRPRG